MVVAYKDLHEMREIICRYGIPKKIIIDNATNLDKKMMSELFEEFKI